MRPSHPGHDAMAHAGWSEMRLLGEECLPFGEAAVTARNAAAYAEWLSARLTIGELQRLLLPGCDERCQERFHEPDAFVALADLALDPAPPRPASWWEDWNATMERRHQAKPISFAGAPAMGATRDDQRLPSGSELVRIPSTH